MGHAGGLQSGHDRAAGAPFLALCPCERERARIRFTEYLSVPDERPFSEVPQPLPRARANAPAPIAL